MRFINGISALTPQEFTEEHLMDFRNFLFDEYKYVARFPKLYKSVKEQNRPSARLSMNTVASQMKMLQTFFTQIENSDEINKSPFRKLCRKTHVDIMNKVQIDIYAAGLHKKGSSAVNRYTLLEIKDRFALMNAAFGQEPYKVNSKLEIVG